MIESELADTSPVVREASDMDHTIYNNASDSNF